MKIQLYQFIFFFLLICCYNQSIGQDNNLVIKGIVADQNGEVLPYATVTLYQSEDSVLIEGNNSDEKGAFSINVPPGKYYLILQFLSYEDLVIENATVSNQNLDLGLIKLNSRIAELNEVLVVTEKKAMEIQLDKRVYNVDKDPMNRGRNASEILDNLPSITVDIDGNVSLRGNQNVRILVDGKPSGLLGIRGTSALKNLQGNILDKIEVITNPSARYDAEGEVGIINIVLKKDKKKGVNGSFDARAGYPEDFGGGFTLNYRAGVVNFFANYSIAYNKRPGFGSSFQQFETADSSFSYERTRDHKRGGLSNNVNAGANFYFKNDHTLTLSGLYSYSHGNNEAHLKYEDFNSAKESVQLVNRDENETEIESTIEASLNYKKSFKKEGHVFTFDFQFTDSKDGESSDITELSSVINIPAIYQEVSNVEDEQKWLIQTDYVLPWSKEGKFETGLKAMIRTIDNDFTVNQQDTNGEWTVLPGFDNQFLYNENIYAAYVMGGNKWGDFQAQIGLRMEYSDVKTHLIKNNAVNHRKYLDLFPSAHFAYEFKHQHNIQLSYSRRISRPRFWSLLPFFGYSDSRNIFSGNPNLNPEYTHSTELGHLKYFTKGSILSSVYFRHTTGKNERLVFADSSGITQIYPVNIGVENSFGLEFTFNYKPWEWWDINASANFYRAIMEGSFQNVEYFNDTYAWNCNAKSKWTIAKIFHVQLSFNYTSPMLDPQGIILSRYNIDAALSLDLLKGKASLTFNARDIFNTRRRRSITYGTGFYSESDFQWRSRQFTINFSYRLNEKSNKGNKEKEIQKNRDGY